MAHQEENADAGFPLQSPRGLYRHFQRTEPGPGAEADPSPGRQRTTGLQHIPFRH